MLKIVVLFPKLWLLMQKKIVWNY